MIDGSTRTVTATVPAGKSADGVAVDPGTHTVYVANNDFANGGDNTVSVIDGSTRTVTATVPVSEWVPAPDAYMAWSAIEAVAHAGRSTAGPEGVAARTRYLTVLPH